MNFSTQDTEEFSQIIVRDMLVQYGFSANSEVKLIAVSENAIYLVNDTDQGKKSVVRICRPGYHGHDELLSEVAWVNAIRSDTAVHTPRAIPALNGQVVWSHRRRNDSCVLSLMFEYVPGVALSLRDAGTPVYRSLGTMTARLHSHSEGWERPAYFTRPSWFLDDLLSPDARFGYWGSHPGLTPSDVTILEKVVDKVQERVRKIPGGRGSIGLVHSDLHVQNVIRDDECLWAIDFDDCGFSWYLQDAAPALACLNPGIFADEMEDAWVAGYRTVRPLSEEQILSLRDFVMARRLYTLGWSTTHPDAAVPALYSDVVATSLYAADMYLHCS